MEQAIVIQNPHWTGKPYTGLKERSLYQTVLNNLETKHIQILTGIRRSGKSSIFRLLINSLIPKTNPKSILLLNMDDPLYYEVWDDASGFYRLVQTAEKITGQKVKYLFIDEAQAVKGWERFVKSAYDNGLFTKVFVTGSNSSFLQNEYSTLLSGRYLENKVFPYSLAELLCHEGYSSILDRVEHTPKVLGQIDKCLEWGCFPEIQSTNNTKIRLGLLKSYFDSIIMKDCVIRYTIGDVTTFKRLLLYVISNAGAIYTYKSLASAVGTNENTTKRYISILDDSHIIKEVSNFAFSLKENARNNHKIYVADTGLMNAASYRFWDNRAMLFENFVFNELQKQPHDEVCFARHDCECDFVVKQGLEYHAIQVCHTLTPENEKRETSSLVKLGKIIPLKSKTIITYNQERTIGDINVTPVWKFF